MLEDMEWMLSQVVSYIEIVLNGVGVCIIIYAVIEGSIKQIKNEASAKHYICRGINIALNYNLATEVLKIIVVRSKEDLIIIGGILILKAMITGLYILEMKQEDLQEKHLSKYPNQKMISNN